MKTLFRFAFLLLLPCLTFGATTNERVTVTIGLTNIPVTGNAWTFQGTTRTWTNASSSSTILTNLSGIGPATTNLANNIAEYLYANGPWNFRWTGSNQFQIVGPVGTALAVSFTGTWATNNYSTQKVALTKAMLFPMDALIPSNRIDQASEMVRGIGMYSTNAIPTNSTVNANYLRRTNDTASNIVIHTPVFTNAVNYGNAFSSPGTNSGSERVGASSVVSGNYSTAFGYGAKATNIYAVALGPNSVAGSNGAVAVGYAAMALNDTAVAIGAGSVAEGLNSIGLGAGAEATHMASYAIGAQVVSTRTNEIRIGGSQDVVIGGLLSVEGALSNTAPILSNGTWTNAQIAASAITVTNLQALGGYDTNRAYDRGFATNLTLGGQTAATGIRHPAFSISTLGEPDNAGVLIGTNTFVRFTGSVTTNAWILGLVGAAASGGADGQLAYLCNATGTNITISMSRLDGTAANRFLTPRLSDVIISNNCSATVIYDSTSSRWRLLSFTQ